MQTFFYKLRKVISACFAGLPILKGIGNSESMRFARAAGPAHRVRFNVEAFVSVKRLGTSARYNNVYGSDCANASLFTTYGIFAGSPL